MYWNFLLPLAQANETQSLGAGLHPLWKLAITAGIIVVAYLAGRLISSAVRMPDYGWKISLITFTVLAGIAIVALGWPPKFGIDLYGGVNLVYEVDATKVGSAGQDVDMDQLIAAVRLRVDPTGTKQILIRPYGQGNAVEIIVPRVSQAEVDELKRQIVDLGSLEFRITANQRDDAQAIVDATALPDEQKVLSQGGREIAHWVPIHPDEDGKRINDLTGGTFITRVITSEDPDVPDTVELLVMMDPYNVNGEFLRRVAPGLSPEGEQAVDFQFNSTGASRFLQLTTEHQPDAADDYRRHLAIALSGEIYTAPGLNEPISDRGQIAGGFKNRAEVEDLVAVLNAGSLPAALNKTPLREQQISPTLGLDTIARGQMAMAVSMGLVLLFVLIYYRFSGIVACLALVTNLVLILAVMISINAAFTLPGLAGLVLTVGMAVDANVLIFERIREELTRGAALRMAIRNGFARATTTIVDANLTTLITAVVLYAIGTDQIKGFAVTLILGILMSMYSAVFCSRVVFEIGERTRRIKKLTMMRMFTSTNINFLGKRMVCGALSVVLIIAGLGAVVMRGSGVLDIDFTGGSQAQILFANETPEGGDERYDTNYVRTKIENWNKEVDDAQGGGGLENYLNGVDPNLIAQLRIAKRTELITEIKNGYSAEERDEMTGGDEDADVDAILEAAAAVEADKRLDDEFDEQLPQLASLADLSVSEVTYLDETDHNPEFVVNTSNRSLIAVETILSKVFVGELDTNTLAFAQATAPAVENDPLNNDPFGNFSPANDPPAGDGNNAGDDNSNSSGGNDAGDNSSGGDNSGGNGLSALSRLPVMNAAFISLQDPPTQDPPTGTDPPVGSGDQTPPPGDVTGQQPPAGEGTDQQPETTSGSARAALTFTHEIGAQDVESIIREVVGSDVQFNVLAGDDSDYVLNSTQAYDNWTVEFTGRSWEEASAWLAQVKSNVDSRPVFPATNNIGSQVASDTRNIGIAAMIASLFFIVLYIWVRFQKVSYGFAAVAALIHDVLITLGAIALSAYLVGIPTIDAFKINLEMLAAFLTLVGYSLNDTIVIFDRIREVKGKSPRLTEEMINTSVNQTLSRTILTSGTTLVVVAILYFFGGQGDHGFSFALFVGVIVGTYSSIFVASPVLLWLTRRSETPTNAGGGSRKTGKLAKAEASASGA